jgi:phospholipid N-methyltransferase
MLTHPRQVGAVWPTSRHAVNDLLDLADFQEARTVVEFGAGTGVYTGEVLNRLRPDGRFLSFELDPGLASAVSSRLTDPRLRVINDSAEHAARYLEQYAEGERADILVSSVPFTSLPAGLRDGLLGAAQEALKSGGRMLVLQYSNAVLSDLERFFGPVKRRISPVNLPPAFLFSCDNPGKDSDVRERENAS